MKFTYSILLLMLFAITFSSCGEEENNNECSDLCEAYEEGPFDNMGDCVSLCATCFNPSESTGNMAVCFCNYIEAILIDTGEDWDDIGIKNKGQCIKFVKNEINNGGGI